MPSRFIYVVANDRTSFCFMTEYYPMGIYLSLDTYVVSMLPWLLWIMLQWTWECRYLLEIVIPFPSLTFPEVGLLDQTSSSACPQCYHWSKKNYFEYLPFYWIGPWKSMSFCQLSIPGSSALVSSAILLIRDDSGAIHSTCLTSTLL